jgi:hypothetical protein
MVTSWPRNPGNQATDFSSGRIEIGLQTAPFGETCQSNDTGGRSFTKKLSRSEANFASVKIATVVFFLEMSGDRDQVEAALGRAVDGVLIISRGSYYLITRKCR